MNTISIKNWEKYQHYKDRNPPWIKLYHSILDDYKYACLQDDSKLLLLTLFLLASRTGNEIPADPEWVKLRGCLKCDVDFAELLSTGFITQNGQCYQVDSKMIAPCKQNACLEKSRDREEKKKTTPPKRRASNGYSDDFEVFWKAYPNKTAKGVAWKAWEKLAGNRPSLSDLLAAVERQKRFDKWTRDGGQYIPHPSTWLNQERWMDEGVELNTAKDRDIINQPTLEEQLANVY